MISIRISGMEDTDRIVGIWRSAVLSTHAFLAPSDFTAIERMVAEEYVPGTPLWLAVDVKDRAVGFMGLSGTHIDSLFVDPELQRAGIGRRLVDHAALVSEGRALTVDVNEQNGPAIGFYERMGFRRIGRSPLDDAGRPYPLLHLRRDSRSD